MMFSPGCGCCGGPACGSACVTVLDGCAGGAAISGATVSISESVFSYISVTSGGSGYTSAPAVSISGGGGTGATATAVVSGGQVTQVNLTAAGSGYTSIPTVSLSGGGGSGATAAGAGGAPVGTCTTSGQVTGVGITNSGSNGPYDSAPAISFSGGGGAGAAATAGLGGGAIQTPTITGAGSGYTTRPAVTLGEAGTLGSGASAVSLLKLDAITIANPGSGYTSGTYSLGFSGGSGTGAAGTYTVSGGVVASTSITNRGSGYIAPPTVSFPSGGGSGAAATATMQVASITVVGGTLYRSPTVTIAPPASGTTATATTTATTIRVTSATVTASGSGYTSAPTVTIAPPASGTTATATASRTVRCCMDLPHNGAYTATATKSSDPLYSPTSGSFLVTNCAAAALSLFVNKYTGNLVGCVPTPGIPGATVALKSGGTTINTHTTDSAGNFPIVFPDGNRTGYTLAVSGAFRFADQTFTITPASVPTNAASCGTTSYTMTTPATGYVCWNCPSPIATTLHVTDDQYGNTIAITYTAGSPSFYSGTGTYNFPGNGDCPAVTGVPVSLDYRLVSTAYRLRISYPTAVNGAGSACPTTGTSGTIFDMAPTNTCTPFVGTATATTGQLGELFQITVPRSVGFTMTE